MLPRQGGCLMLQRLGQSLAVRLRNWIPDPFVFALALTLIVGLLAEQGQRGLNTFSVGFESVDDEAGDEFQYSDIIARHFDTDHHQIRVDSARLLPALQHCIQAMSEPMVSHDVIGFYLLSQEVSKHVKVVQSGQGADEVFAGYHWYPPLRDSSDPIEQEGVRRAWAQIEQADRVLLVIDDQRGRSPADQAILERLPHDLPHTLVFNKIDLSGRAPGIHSQGAHA